MKQAIQALSVLLVSHLLVAQTMYAQQPSETPKATSGYGMKDQLGIHMVATSEVVAELAAGGARERITGRVSLHLVATSENLEKRQVLVRGFNVAFFGVSQKLLSGSAPPQEPLGVLGFATDSSRVQALRYDEKGQLYGELQMSADASFLNAFAEPIGDAKNDLFETPVVPTTATVRIDLREPLPRSFDELSRIPAKLDLQLRTKGAQYKNFTLPPFEVRLIERVLIPIEIASFRWFEVAQRLCVQPVNLLSFQWVPWRFGAAFPWIQFSGAGLPFGEPGARTQWRKADVVFEIRDWKTVWASTYWVLDASEANGLRALVDDDDCIEVFFVYDLSPQDQWGGGATWGSGTASAKIISSDGNARGGVDLTHLAHELGHVLGLRHPGDPPTSTAQAASSGTLMCPSGYLNDNPRVNSQENEDLLSNALLTFALKLRSAGPDCLNSTDCGPCP